MYILKGFLSFPALTNNAVGEVSPVGELSKDSLTYAKETGLYKDPLYPGVLLSSFKSHSDQDGQIEVPARHYQAALALGDRLYEFAQTGQLTSNQAVVLQTLETEFRDRLENIQIGEMQTDQGLWLPEWISYRLVDTDNYTRLWLSDSAFSGQYDDFEYEFIPPLEDLDDLFRSKEQVLALLAQNGVKRLVERIDITRGLSPYTLIRTEEYPWVNPNDPEDEIVTGWTVMIYGRAGNDPDQIRLALIDWILKNTRRSRSEWLELFPDIFTPTEFIVAPLWHQFAVPNQTIQSGLNSPMVSLSRALEIAQALCKGIGYDDVSLMDNTVITPTPYRTLSALIVGSAANRHGVSDFRDMYPDYIGLSIGSPDFARLKETTQQWVRVIIDLMRVAENMTTYTIIPPGYARIVRDDVVYAVRDFDGMQYLMVTRLSAIRALGLEAPYTPEYDEDLDQGLCDLDTRMIREHLMYLDNPHQTEQYQIGLDKVQDVDMLTLDTGISRVGSDIDRFLEAKAHGKDTNNPHGTRASHLGLEMVVNQRMMTAKESLARLKL